MKKRGYKDIFIFITGSTPQVITETIYALAMKKPPVYPHEIYIITTCKGREMAWNALIDRGILKTLMHEYNMPPVTIKETSFLIPSACTGQLDDIRDEEENEAMGDLITSFIMEKTKEQSKEQACRLHCSIAGGRKTMSFYLGSAMQMFARPWDKLYHVLVSPEFESTPDFYYKPKKDRIIERNGKRINTKNAVITLAELPFIRLRDKISPEGKGFKYLVKEGQKEIDIAMIQPEVRMDFSRRIVAIGQKQVKFTPLHLMIYGAYLKRKLQHCKFPKRQYCLDCTECFPSLLDLSTKPALEEMAKDYMKMHPSRVDDLLHKYKTGLSVDVIRQAISKIKKAIGEALEDEAMTSIYAITSPRREYANTRHGIRVEKDKIRILQ